MTSRVVASQRDEDYPRDPHGLLALPAARLATQADLASRRGVSMTKVKEACSRAGVRYAKLGPGQYLYELSAALVALGAAPAAVLVAATPPPTPPGPEVYVSVRRRPVKAR